MLLKAPENTASHCVRYCAELEFRPTIHKHVKADSQGPDVCNLAMVGGAFTHFWGQESWGAHGSYCCVAMVHHASTAKVTDLHTPIRCQQHVVRLQVTMYDAFGVQVVQALRQQHIFSVSTAAAPAVNVAHSKDV